MIPTVSFTMLSMFCMSKPRLSGFSFFLLSPNSFLSSNQQIKQNRKRLCNKTKQNGDGQMLGKIVKIVLSMRNCCYCFLFAPSLHALLFLEEKANKQIL